MTDSADKFETINTEWEPIGGSDLTNKTNFDFRLCKSCKIGRAFGTKQIARVTWAIKAFAAIAQAREIAGGRYAA